MAHDDTVRRDSVAFESQGTRCAGWLYRPDESVTESEDPPVVVMAHGFGATREMGLPAYAERFTERGLAVLLFDYRTFGESDGAPRNVVDPFRHIENYRAAISHARSLDDTDGDRIGVSFRSPEATHSPPLPARTWTPTSDNHPSRTVSVRSSTS